MSRRLKVLVSAYACNPYKGSEEGVGWGWVTALAEHHDLWVLTADFHRPDIERALADRPVVAANVSFHYVLPKWCHYAPTKGWRFIEGSFLKPLMNGAYSIWQNDAYRVARQLHADVGFDLAHLVTYVGFRFPGHLWRLGIPFVWGPIGGLDNVPWRFLPALGLSGGLYHAGRNAVNSLQRRFLPGPKRAFREARGSIIAATESMRRQIYRWYGEESEVICEIGPPHDSPQDALSVPAPRSEGESLRIVWSGLHLPAKALPLLLKALALLPAGVQWKLTILGHGPCTTKWQQVSHRLGIVDRCEWLGWVSRDHALTVMGAAHVFAITSIKDLTSTVLLEALAQGVPVVCPDHCGFADVVTDDCGIKVPIRTPGRFVADLASAIRQLAQDESKRRRLAEGALRRIRVFAWDAKIDRVNSIYQRVVGEPSHYAAANRADDTEHHAVAAIRST